MTNHTKALEYSLKLQRRVQHLDIRINIMTMELEKKYENSFISAQHNNKDSNHNISLGKTINENIEILKEWLKPKYREVLNPCASIIGQEVIYKDKKYIVESIPNALELKLKDLDAPIISSNCKIEIK